MREGAGGACGTLQAVIWLERRRLLAQRLHQQRAASSLRAFFPRPLLHLQNPFYELDMPIRIRLFDFHVEAHARGTGLAPSAGALAPAGSSGR